LQKRVLKRLVFSPPERGQTEIDDFHGYHASRLQIYHDVAWLDAQVNQLSFVTLFLRRRSFPPCALEPCPFKDLVPAAHRSSCQSAIPLAAKCNTQAASHVSILCDSDSFLKWSNNLRLVGTRPRTSFHRPGRCALSRGTDAGFVPGSSTDAAALAALFTQVVFIADP
jgi:hypothetical protein